VFLALLTEPAESRESKGSVPRNGESRKCQSQDRGIGEIKRVRWKWLHSEKYVHPRLSVASICVRVLSCRARSPPFRRSVAWQFPQNPDFSTGISTAAFQKIVLDGYYRRMRKLWHKATFGDQAWKLLGKMNTQGGMTVLDHQSAMCEWDKHTTKIVCDLIGGRKRGGRCGHVSQRCLDPIRRQNL
jgi:hypothetical protein